MTTIHGEDRQAVITGIGLVTPLGIGRSATWSALCRGERAAVVPLGLHTSSAGVWPELAAVPVMRCPLDLPDATTCRRDEFTRLALVEALTDAELTIPGTARIGCTYAASKPDFQGSDDRAWRPVPRDFWPHAASTRILTQLAIEGPCLSPIAACATGLASADAAARLIQLNAADVVICGAGEASLQPLVVAGFRRLGVTAPFPRDPRRACTPFDEERQGLVLGEGAAVIIMEAAAHARARGVAGYARWEACRLGTDPAGMTTMTADGSVLRELLQRGSWAGTRRPDLVHLHGTGTRMNDEAECHAMHSLAMHDIPVWGSASKGQCGHLLGAAAAVELAFCALALREQVVPPLVNLERPMAHLSWRYAPEQGVAARLDRVLKVALGFGGHVALASLTRITDP